MLLGGLATAPSRLPEGAFVGLTAGLVYGSGVRLRSELANLFLWDLFSRGFAGHFTRAGERTRTADPLFTRQALYQLSYSGAIGGEDARQL
jgi:hypothetical protein